MTYCAKCGKKNEDDARFCNGCGAPLGAVVREQRKDQCDQDCSGTSHKGSWFWAIIVILIGLWIIFEFGVKNIQGLPPELANFQLWWLFPIVIGIVVIALGVGMLRKQGQAK
jgi:uncharacterized membrane protein YvbJ